ncbi:Abortive infection protein [Clostridium sp. DL-VIII]|uniref:CPBP family intramembrane glutamic endopeptidase n=1 Tax=Clostridium sp. DL-VIII TaxID=641107 RepID=UPI00023B04F8|nr:CPBP family intramembrane glutamic endopeptidase [Clostridium sp. DL-VIII]EHJ01410.1 Abortive infection protein [Clostridium sp. DL-VIII]
MKILKCNNKLIKSLLKIGGLFLAFYITLNILSDIFFMIYKAVILAVNPEFAVNNALYANYLNKQLSSISSFPSVCLILIQCICMIFYVILFWGIFERKSIKDIGLTKTKGSLSDLCFGVIIGAMSFIIVALVLICTKSVKLQSGLSKTSILYPLIIQLIIFIFVGISEELFSRGYCMNILKEGRKSWFIPIIVSSVIFSLLHSMNQGISLLAYINLFLFAVFMAGIYIKTKNLWMCIGYHTAWNYFQGPIFGFSVSGAETDSLYNIRVISSNIINGGSFGPEGGLVVTMVLVISIFITYKFSSHR